MAEHGKRPPKEVTDYLSEYGGKNVYNEPMFRIVWGADRLSTKMGLWEDTGIVEARQVPKYPLSQNRWVVEVWVPPSYYGTPEEWAANTEEYVDGKKVEVLGEYPRRGDYEIIDTIEDLVCECGRASGAICDHCGTASRYLEPTRDYVKYLVDAYHYAKTHVIELAEKSMAQAEKTEANRAETYLDMIKDNAPVNSGLPTVSYAGLNWGSNGNL